MLLVVFKGLIRRLYYKLLPINDVRKLFDLSGVEVEPAIFVLFINKRHDFGQVL